MKQWKQFLTAAVFGLLLAGGLVLHLLLPDGQLSTSERRWLAQMPEPTAKTFLSGRYAKDLETYLLDQFPGREAWRRLKAVWTCDVLRQKDNNGIYRSGGSLSKLDPILDGHQVQRFVEKMNGLRETYFSDSTVYCAVIPDKNYHMDGLKLDYTALFQQVEAGLPWAQHVDLTSCLEAADYYATDSHWRQERLDRVTAALAEAMGLTLPDWASYEAVTLEGFWGVYGGQSALPLPTETLTYLESGVTRAAQVTGPELEDTAAVYAPERFDGLDGYDVFLHGAQAILTVENPLAETDRELILFRDSFGSSLAPLLLPGYRRITLVDIRYVSPANLGRFVSFHGQDVLLLYSTTVINSAGVLR